MTRAIYSIFDGGLGNQLFQYAFSLWLYRTLGAHRDIYAVRGLADVRAGRSLQLGRIGINLPLKPLPPSVLADILLCKSLGPSGPCRLHRHDLLFEHPSWSADLATSELRASKALYVYGYWQNTLFAEHARPTLLAITTRYEPLSAIATSALAQVQAHPIIAVHVRRGDYVHRKRARDLLLVCTKNYFLRSVTRALADTGCRHVLVFSDDIPWCKRELGLDGDVTFIDERIGAHEQFLIMSRCQHFIISNSTFSWWAAFLGTAPDKHVYCPDHWHVGTPTSLMPLHVPSWHPIEV